jgi:hypothetical protein
MEKIELLNLMISYSTILKVIYLLIINIHIEKALSLCYYEKDPNEFSLALLEKAFIKVYGGV